MLLALVRPAYSLPGLRGQTGFGFLEPATPGRRLRLAMRRPKTALGVAHRGFTRSGAVFGGARSTRPSNATHWGSVCGPPSQTQLNSQSFLPLLTFLARETRCALAASSPPPPALLLVSQEVKSWRVYLSLGREESTLVSN